MCSCCPTYVCTTFPNHATRGAEYRTIGSWGLRDAFLMHRYKSLWINEQKNADSAIRL